MDRNHPKNTLFLAILLLVSVLFITACDGQMGLGDPVDLEATELVILGVRLEDGTVIDIQEGNNKLFIGPGILIGAGAVLFGEAKDNDLVVEVFVEEVGENRTVVNGVNPNWSVNIENQPKDSDGWQEWSISLDGIQGGQRVINVTAHDRPQNIGPDSVQQLTLLVDVNPPFVESIKIERAPGKQVDLLPRQILEDFDESLFENINYFQNEYFTIRANIDHDFSLSEVRLNLVNEEGNKIFTNDLTRSGGSLYTPSWVITHDQLVAANAVYASGRRYLSVVITATASAGHSGQNENIDNTFFSLCWYPESDFARIVTPRIPATGNILVEKGAIIPITVFDDDEVEQVYTGLISLARWEEVPGADDDDKLAYLLANHLTFKDELGFEVLAQNRLAAPVSTTVISLNVTKNRGAYRLISLVRDKKTDNTFTGGGGMVT